MTDEPLVLVTGATDGLGKQVARDIAAEGASIALHGRKRDHCLATAEWIRNETGNDRIECYVADFASLDEVRRLASEIREQHDRLDVLVNNAGIGGHGRQRETSADGYELRFAVNYLAPFLLTRHLLPLLKASAPARIVNVSSIGQQMIDFDDVMLEHDYHGKRAYDQSKLAQIMFTFDLAEELNHTGVTTTAVHPATLMPTKLTNRSVDNALSTLEEGTHAVVRLATAPEMAEVTGQYFDVTTPARANDQAYDPQSRAQLRTLSEQLMSDD